MSNYSYLVVAIATTVIASRAAEATTAYQRVRSNAPIFEGLFESSSGDNESSVSEPVDQLFMSIAVGKAWLLEPVSEGL
jgi:hypothetical protein